MTTEEAYYTTIETILELISNGIEVKIKKSNSSSNEETIQRYSGPERVSQDKWIHVELFYENKEQQQLIYEKAKELSWLGIFFDTGGCSNERDWELDWSFHYTGTPDGDVESAREEVEEIILNNSKDENQKS